MARRQDRSLSAKAPRLPRRKSPRRPDGHATTDAENDKQERLSAERDELAAQHTATAELLQIISTSIGNLDPVFEAVLRRATQLCQASFGNLWLREQDAFRIVATYGAPASYKIALFANPLVKPHPESAMGQLARTRKALQVEDITQAPDHGMAFRTATVNIAKARTLFAVPMLRNGEVVGIIAIYRKEVRPFTPRQIDLVASFGAQAVIAIENTRLLKELRESLEQQTATSDVLKVISSSPGSLEPVFNAMLENAVRICNAQFGVMHRFVGDEFGAVAMRNIPPALEKFLRDRGVAKSIPGTDMDRLTRSKQVIHTIDMLAELSPSPPAKLAGARTQLAVPMLKDGELVGAIVIYRQEVLAFSDKQIELLSNFAAQAVIAIENARLLNDLNKLNHQLEQRVAEQVGEIERMGRLRRFLPPQVADLIVASGSEKQLESHRREITALFCDLRGFTGFSESSDPEDVMTLLRDYHAAIGEIIIRYSGTLERYAGDGVMVIFNDPVPVSNPALQAVKMALDMRVSIGVLIEKWRRLGHDLGFGIGIAHGFATLGTIGFEGRFDYAAIGTVSNVASRLCDEAKPGQILISPRVLMAVENDVVVESVGEFELKGLRRPMSAYNVLSAGTQKPSHA